MPRNGLGVAGMVCGIVGLVFAFVPFGFFFALPLGVLALVFGAVGMRRAMRGEATNRGVAIAGLVTGIAAVGLAILVSAAIGSAINQTNNDLNSMNSDVVARPAQFRVDQQRVNHQEHLDIRQAWVIHDF